ncbi:MAG: alkaline phosphatase family protein [Methanotrichaceae archaeon]
MRKYSLVDIAPTIAKVLRIDLPRSDGCPIEEVTGWECKNVILIIVDSLGYELYRWLEPDLKNMQEIASKGFLLRAEAVSNRTTPAIASILSGLIPEHHGIYDKAGAIESSILSLPEIASCSGLRSAVIMERNGAEVYQGLIEIIGGVSDSLSPKEFDSEIHRLSLDAISYSPRLLVSYYIGIDKTVHLGLGPKQIKDAAMFIDNCIGKLIRAVKQETMVIICGDHAVHAGALKRTHEPYCVALIVGSVDRSSL